MATSDRGAATRPGGASRGRLLRILGLGFGLAAALGGMVGQGILRAPGIVAEAVPSAEWIIILWIAGGLVTAVSAFAFVELGTAIPCAGGPYVFVRRAFGPFAGTLMGWADWLNSISTQAFLVVVVAEFAHRLGMLNSLSGGATATIAICGVWALNWIGTRTGAVSQTVGSALKAAALLALVLVLLVGGDPPGPQSQPAADGGLLGLAALTVAFRAIYNTYDGSSNGVYFTEEMTTPERDYPRSVFGGIALVTALYVLTNVALLQVMTPQQLTGSELAVADAAEIVLGVIAATAVTLFSLVSVLAVLNLNLMFSARIVFGMARDGLLPRRLSAVAPSGTPRLALSVTAIGAILLASSGSYEQLIAINVGIAIFMQLVLNAAVISLRRREPELHRPFRTPFYPWPIIATLTLYGALAVALLYEDALNTMLGLLAVGVIGGFYALAGSIRRRTESSTRG